MNRKYPIQVTSSTSLLPKLPNDASYFIVGAISKEPLTTIHSVKKAGAPPNTIMACPPRVPINLPGLGLPISQFKVDSPEVQVFYYTTT